jgi:hypothetical protein
MTIFVFAIHIQQCKMGNFSKMQEEKREGKEKDKTRREKLAGYFFDLSKLSFAGLVVGGIVSIKPDNIDYSIEIYRAIIGCFFTISLARIANIILK